LERGANKDVLQTRHGLTALGCVREAHKGVLDRSNATHAWNMINLDKMAEAEEEAAKVLEDILMQARGPTAADDIFLKDDDDDSDEDSTFALWR
jgi:hypothetical protein